MPLHDSVRRARGVTRDPDLLALDAPQRVGHLGLAGAFAEEAATSPA